VRALRVLAEDVVEELAVASMMLFDTQQAFDGVAAGYDRSNAANPTLCHMRARAWDAMDAFVPRDSHVIDLGCGPGCDAEHLARVGYRVTAIDWSRAMVEEARRRVQAAGVAERVDVLHVGIHEIDQLAPVRFDAAYSNFGPLNCVDDLAAAARLIANRLRPGGVLVASVIGRVCPWELALYLARGRWWRAAIRFRREPVPVPLEGRTVWTRYYTPGNFARIFATAGFTPVSLRTLGLVVPPPYLDAFAGRHPRVISALQNVEDRVGGWPGIRTWGDHFLIVLRKA
jgi:SAM-dependent methyltransferase